MAWRLSVLTLAGLAMTASAAAEEVVLSSEDCTRVVAHVPAPDVAYQAGVDATGNPVVPADLEYAQSLDLDGEDVAVEIAVPLRAVSGIPGNETAFVAGGGKIDRFAADAHVGVVTVSGGDVYLNGRLISSHELGLLAAACREP